MFRSVVSIVVQFLQEGTVDRWDYKVYNIYNAVFMKRRTIYVSGR